METHVGIFIFLTVLPLVFTASGVQLSIDRFPGQKVCARLVCDIGVNDDIAKVKAITIHEFYNGNSERRTRLASISNNGDSFYINPSRGKEIKVTGSMSECEASLTVEFNKEDDCVYSSYQCELEYEDNDGHIAYKKHNIASGSVREVEVVQPPVTRAPEIRVVQPPVTRAPEIRVVEPPVTPAPPKKEEPPVTQAPPVATPKPMTCTRGEAHTYRYEKITLLGSIQVLCDTHTDGGGWVLIQRRIRGDIDFRQNWYAYKNGFGHFDGDFWLGNDNIHKLTANGYTIFRADISGFVDNIPYSAEYNNFVVDNEANRYRMTIGGMTGGNAIDSMSYHNGMYFTTFDRDNDLWARTNCASREFSGGWWFNACFATNPNGLFGRRDKYGIAWGQANFPSPLRSIELKLRHV